MKKILAGILAAVSMLSVSATAFATDKTVTKPGEVEYDVPVTAPTVVLNLVMPAKMAAALNPYGAEMKLDEAGTKTSKNGVVSMGYTVTNNSKEYGVYFDATAITTIETADKEKWSVKQTAADTAGTRGADIALVAAKDLDAFATVAVPTAASKPAAKGTGADPDQGYLVMNSEQAADKAAGTVLGQTTQKKVFFIPAATGDAAPGKIVMGFVGKLAASSVDKEVEWTEDDAININLILKVTAGPKTLA